MEGKKKARGAVRKAQIINSAVGLISSRGLAGATTARIAADVGVTEPALYRHFKNKHSIILAALDEVIFRLVGYALASGAGTHDMPTRFRVMSAAYYDFVMSHPEEMRVLFEAISAARSEEMRQEMRAKIDGLLQAMETVLAEGIEQGTFRKDADLSLISWEIISLGITLYMASILDFKDVLTKEKALAAVDALLATIEVKNTRERRDAR